jgi:hypothetical protein
MLDRIPGRLLAILLVVMLIAGCLVGRTFLHQDSPESIKMSVEKITIPTTTQPDICGRICGKIINERFVKLWLVPDGSHRAFIVRVTADEVIWDVPSYGLVTVHGQIWSYDGRESVVETKTGMFGSALKGAKSAYSKHE